LLPILIWIKITIDLLRGKENRIYPNGQ
jgi:hypothetical protein